ncbi:MAG: type IX secretion system sortase PorU [Candidatus Cloacimonetes bacterium]|nr:type IX secretion system sortase PorU [Candidatus Cloacimonadota bacterium]
MGVFISCPLLAHSPVSVIKSNADNLTIEFTLPGYELISKSDFVYIDCPDLMREEIEGKIDLPIYSFLVGVPVNGNTYATILSKDEHFIDIKAPIAPFPAFVDDPSKDTYRPVYNLDKQKYQLENSKEILEISEPYFWRQQQVVKVSIRPFIVDNNTLKIIKNLNISFSLSGNKKQSLFTDENFELVFKNAIINFDVAKGWSSAAEEGKQFNPFSQAHRWFRIQISDEGICKITKQNLSQAGADVDNLDPYKIKIFNGGGFSQNRSVYSTLYPFEEIPVFVKESGSDFTIYFYVRGTNGFDLNEDYDQYYNPYTGENTYWLTYNTDLSLLKNPAFSSENTKERESLNTYIFSEHIEEEQIRTDPLEIVWYWSSFTGSGASTKYFDFNVSDLNTSEPQQISLRFNYRPYSAYLDVYVNNTLLTDYTWSSSKVTFTGNFLTNGKNELKVVETTSGSQTLYFDYYEVSYTKNLKMQNDYLALTLPQDNVEYTVNVTNVSSNELSLFKVTEFNQVAKITDYQLSGSTLSFDALSEAEDTKFCIVNSGGYIVPDIEEKLKPQMYLNGSLIADSYLRSDSTLANTEAIIITPEQFWDLSTDLADVHHQYDDLNVLVVNINDVYDEFSWGLTDVVAIRYFLNYVYDYYAFDPSKKLAYCLLVGDGTNDFRGYEQGSEEKNKILPFVEGTVASDDYFVYFLNKTNPSLMIGRLPGYTDTQMEIMIEKNINYVTQPSWGYWRNRVILSADDFLKQGKNTETGHTTHAESCARRIEYNVELLKNYGIMYPLDEFQSKPEANDDLIKMINNGAAVFYYIGHGGYDVIGDEEYFRSSRDISKLTNAYSLNFFLAASCDIGLFDSNTIESMAERMLYSKGKGSIAVFASARKGGYGPCSDIVALVVNDADEGITIGQAVLASKGGSPSKSYEKYLLLGNPMLKTALPAVRGDITIPAEYADSLKARQTAEMIGIIDTTGYEFDEVFNVVFDTDYSKDYPYDYRDPNTGSWEIRYLAIVLKGEGIFKGPVSSENNEFDLGFVVPDDVLGGQEGQVLSYSIGTSNEKDVDILLRYNKRTSTADHDLIINGYAEAENDGPPRITMWLDNDSFKSGDYVSSSPLVNVEIIDSNGVNITNYPGHRILLTVDNESEYNITENFVYDLNSYITGSIEYQLESIPAGIHTMRLEVFDNLNEVAFKDIEFKVKEPDNIDVRTVLNYPNPMNDHTYFTFYLDGDATVNIEIFTVAGRKIKTIKTDQKLRAGYNQIYWDGKDDDGDNPSNGVYFYKLIVNAKRIDDTFKIIIFH